METLIVLGPPGSGKGTQAKLLVKELGLEYFGSGAVLRKRSEKDDFIGNKIREIQDRGEWVPPAIICKLWLDVFEKFKADNKLKGFISDGSPRTMLEAQLFTDALKLYDWYDDVKVLTIDISDEEAFNRLTKRRICEKCGKLIPWLGKFKDLERCECGGELIVRHDDEPKAISKRIKEFREKTVPVLDYYEEQGKLIRVNGEQSIEEVFKDILKAVQ